MVQMRLADGNRSWKGGLVLNSDSDLGAVLGVRGEATDAGKWCPRVKSDRGLLLHSKRVVRVQGWGNERFGVIPSRRQVVVYSSEWGGGNP